MQRQAREIQYFFYSQAFADGIRISAAILLPALLFSYFGKLDLGLSISLGALCVSLTDAPGPIIHKKNGMLICAFFIFVTALLTAFARMNIYSMGIMITVASFFFSMFGAYGNRAIAVGNAAILVMILTMDKPIEPSQALLNSALILGGGLWYLAISLLFHNLQPYRAPQRILGECIREVATYLSIKADFYNPLTDLDDDYRKLVAQQVVVSEKQDAVREILFKTRQIVKESTRTGRKLVWTFVETVDLFEDITASYYDYSSLRKRFADSGILGRISTFIREIAWELSRLGVAIQMNSYYRSNVDFDSRLRRLKEEIDLIAQQENESSLVLKKILVNLRRLVNRFAELNQYFAKEERANRKDALDHSHFVSHQSLDPSVFSNNLTFKSSIFRHAVRVSIACTAGFIVAKLFSYGHHSYWILMTIAFILKPAFGLTKQRNIERIVGTVIGGAVGAAILIFIPNRDVQFALMVIFMIGNYSFLRINYLAMVLCVTPFVLILFSFLGMGFLDVAKERVLDTIVGCAIAFSASYFLFPTWESDQLRPYLSNLLRANAAYFARIMDGLAGRKIDVLKYKLARKEVYVSSANLSAAFQRMLSEPKNKQRNREQLHQFVVLSNILVSNLATVATGLVRKEPRHHANELLALARKTGKLLSEILLKLEPDVQQSVFPEMPARESMVTEVSADDQLLKDQLEFIYKVVTDIGKTVDVILGINPSGKESQAHTLSVQAQ